MQCNKICSECEGYGSVRLILLRYLLVYLRTALLLYLMLYKICSECEGYGRLLIYCM